MRLSKILLVALSCSFWYSGSSQLINQYTQYTDVLSAYNPAFSGIENYTDLRFGYRKQWIGIENSPVTTFVNLNGVIPQFDPNKNKKVRYKSPFDVEKLTDMVQVPNNGLRMSNPELLRRMVRDSINKAVSRLDYKAKTQLRRKMATSPIKFQTKHGISLNALSDQQGAFSTFSGTLGYAFHLPLSKKWMISSGVSANLMNTTIDKNKLSVLDPNDLLYAQFISGNFNSTGLLFNTGLLLYSSDFYLSYSVQKLISRSIGKGYSFIGDLTEIQHSAIAGLTISGRNFSIAPGLLFTLKEYSPLIVQFNSKVFYQEKIWLGINFRNGDSMGGVFGLFFNDRYKFSYSYDASLNQLSNNAQSTHEVIFGILLGRGSSPNPIVK